MFQKIAALKVRGSGIIFAERSVMDQIMLLASGMLIDRSKKAKIKNPHCEGEIVTDFHCTAVGCLFGTEFFLWIDTDHGRVFLDFILPQPIQGDELRSIIWAAHPEGMSDRSILDSLRDYFA